MQKRTLGNTGESLSIVGFGGIVVMNEEPAAATRLVAQAIDRGINYFDVAPSYGNAQERLGPALAPYRDKVFLACKTGHRDKVGAAAELRESLRLLQTDHFDLYQMHGVSKMEDVEQILAPGGALEAFIEARDAGLIRYLGFSGHHEEAGIRMLESFPFASALFPVNWVCWQQGQFGSRLLNKVLESGAGALALKTLAQRPWNEGEGRMWSKCWYHPIDDPAEAMMAARFTLSKPITAAVSPGHAELLWLLCDAAENFTPLTPEEEQHLATCGAQYTPIFQT